MDAVGRLLAEARSRGFTDLHLEPDETSLVVRARRDGVLLPLEALPRELGPRLVGRLKSLAGLLAYRTDVPQEGRIPADRSGIGVEVRVATFPALLGERVALRFEDPAAALRLADLGFPPAVRSALERAVDEPEGVVLVTGPSGSGKTTTLYACLRRVAEAATPRAILTVEDPVERRVPGVTQTQVNPAAGLDFARALRSLLRQDPEVLLVGEIRDRETAAIALEAGLTGHLVASTLHAGHAALVFARLLELGVEPFVLTTAVRGVLAQRLLRRACSACAARGCEACGETGYAGRVLAAEWLEVSAAALREAVHARRDGAALAAAAQSAGMRTLRECATDLVRQGLTTPEEVQRVLGRA